MISKNMEIREYKEIDDEIIEIMASDESVDRDNDVIKVDGWNAENWVKTGSLIYGHDPSSPFNVVGSAEGAEVRDGKLYLYSRLAKKGTSPTHDAIRSLIDQKILKGVSVGFKSTDWEANEHGGRNFLKQELLEISLVPVPANSNAHVVKNFDSTICEDLIIDESNEKVLSEQDNIDIEIKRLKDGNQLLEETIMELSTELDELIQKNKDLQALLDDKNETEDVKAYTPSDKEVKFLDLLNKK